MTAVEPAATHVGRGTATPLGPDSVVRLHRLVRRREHGEWLVGRIDIGEVVALPDTGVRVIDLLADGLTVDQARLRLTGEVRRPVDVAGFARELLRLGFVAAVDDVPQPSAPPRRPMFARLLPRHTAWIQHPATAWCLVALVLAGALRTALAPHSFPDYRTLLWSRRGSLVLATTFVGGWALLMLHECAHLAAARAVGIPSRIRLGTRLQFLVAQTDISGIELFPRRCRLTAYLAGIAVNLGVTSAAVLALPLAGPGSAVHRAVAVAALLSAVQLPFQLLVFMRTDLYFVLQDLTGCRDLHQDGRAYLRYLPGRIRHALGLGDRCPDDPTRGLPARERTAVRWYSVLLALGSCGCLLVLATVTLPTDATLLLRAGRHLGPDEPVGVNLDAATVLLVLGGVQAMWISAKIRGRRRRDA